MKALRNAAKELYEYPDRAKDDGSFRFRKRLDSRDMTLTNTPLADSHGHDTYFVASNRSISCKTKLHNGSKAFRAPSSSATDSPPCLLPK